MYRELKYYLYQRDSWNLGLTPKNKDFSLSDSSNFLRNHNLFQYGKYSLKKEPLWSQTRDLSFLTNGKSIISVLYTHV